MRQFSQTETTKLELKLDLKKEKISYDRKTAKTR